MLPEERRRRRRVLLPEERRRRRRVSKDPVDLVCGLLVREQTALLVHRSPDREIYPDVWDFPGGHVESGESLEAALVRELDEELGIRASLPTGSPDLALTGTGWRLAVWIVRDWEGEPSNRQPDEHDDLRWFDLPDALALDFADPEYRDVLRSALGEPDRPFR